MNFDDFITLIFFLVFIVSPFLKRKKAKKPGKAVQSEQSGFSVLGKLRDALKEAVREMEAKAEQTRKNEAPGQDIRPIVQKKSGFDLAEEKSATQTFWDEIDDRKDVDFYPKQSAAQVLKPVEHVNEKPIFMSTNKEPHRKAARIPDTREAKPLPPKSVGHDAMQTRCTRPGPRMFPARARGLQKAVIWSEILDKPVALKD